MTCINCYGEIGDWGKTFCSRSCAVTWRWKDSPTRDKCYKYVHAPGHFLARGSSWIREHRVVLFEKIGSGSHPCHHCGVSISWMPGAGNVEGALLADHLNGNRRDNSPDNLVPSCHTCNTQRRVKRAAEMKTGRPDGYRPTFQKNCGICGKEFFSRRGKKETKFCSRSCGALSRYSKGPQDQ